MNDDSRVRFYFFFGAMHIFFQIQTVIFWLRISVSTINHLFCTYHLCICWQQGDFSF